MPYPQQRNSGQSASSGYSGFTDTIEIGNLHQNGRIASPATHLADHQLQNQHDQHDQHSQHNQHDQHYSPDIYGASIYNLPSPGMRPSSALLPESGVHGGGGTAASNTASSVHGLTNSQYGSSVFLSDTVVDDQSAGYSTPMAPYPGAGGSVGGSVGMHSGASLSQYSAVSGVSPGQSTPTLLQSTASLAGLLPQPPPQQLDRDWVRPGQIARLHERDDAEQWKGWKRHLFRLLPPMMLVNTLLQLGYLAYRIYCIATVQSASHTVYVAAWVFVSVELSVTIPPLLHSVWTIRALKQRNRPRLRLTGDDVPTVDVFVTCCGEDDDIVVDTARAACDQDYPQARFRVVVLDDAKSASLEEAVTALARTYPNLYYRARTKIPGKPHHFKSGNLNYGVEQVALLPGGPGALIGALDADMIPERDWLSAIVPHLLLDPRMALVCPPQLFYNTPPSDPLAQSLDYFVHVIEPIKDALGVAWCTGSGYVVRRAALEEIGCFPLGSLAEDVATSTMLLGRGWKTAYVHEPLQFGTVPEDYGSHLKQRTRWAIGTVDNAIKMKFSLYGDTVRHMTKTQRFSGFIYAMLTFYSILLVISLFAIPIILAWGRPLIAYANDDQLRWLLRAVFVATIFNRLTEFVMSMPAGYHNGQRAARYQLWMAPYISLCIIRSFVLPKWLGGQAQAFKPTGSLGSAINERDPAARKNLLRRLWAVLVNYMAGFHLVFLYFTLVAACITSFRCVVVNEGDTRATLICLLTHAFWPPLTLIFICSSLFTPIAYAIDPPSMPDRESLLVRDPKTGVAHPTEASKKVAFDMQAVWFELEYSLSTAFTILVFVCSFIF